MDSLHFQFDTKYYQQITELPIGLSFSPILADLVLQDLEDFLKKYNRSFSFYCRYVDDSFIVFIKKKLPVSLKYLNQIHSRIKFTCEKVNEIQAKNKISFLDILIERTNEENICIDVYKKKTFSGR